MDTEGPGLGKKTSCGSHGFMDFQQQLLVTGLHILSRPSGCAEFFSSIKTLVQDWGCSSVIPSMGKALSYKEKKTNEIK